MLLCSSRAECGTLTSSLLSSIKGKTWGRGILEEEGGFAKQSERKEEREIEDGQFDAEPAKVAGAQRTSSRPDSHDHLALSGPLKV